MNRRSLLAGALGAFGVPAAPSKRRRAAVIGHTGRGNYGHGLDIVWKAFEAIEVVAVADADEAGRAKAVERAGAKRGYRDYREMLRKEKPDLVSIGPRWLDQRVEMVTAAAEAGCHIYLEKPFARDLQDADRMVEAIRRAGVKVQLAHQMRGSPFVRRVQEVVDAGEIGAIQEIRGRGKEDHRAGGEDMMVLGSHICDVMRIFAGDPNWVTAHVTEKGHELNRGHVRTPTEPIGPVAGREIAATFAFDRGVHGYFASKASDETHPLRFATQIVGTKGVVFLPNGIYPDGQPYILRTPSWLPDEKHAWEKIGRAAPVPGEAELRGDHSVIANALMVLDLLDAIERGRKPICSEHDGRWTIEMIMGVYEAQRTGARTPFPLERRRHPLESW
ncbi:MAG: Gfo/Idh/MocA family oxidoreductase [Bryobacteraceae bacterium]|nr:Gfo/Idh/MocA family oxidoreductase [Bryobacteraceae bacterium]